MQQGDLTASYYQYYRSYFQHSDPYPISNSNDLQASAPPFSDHQSYSSPYPQYSDNGTGHPPTAPTCPPNPNFHSPDQNQTTNVYDIPCHAHNSNMNSVFPGNLHSASAGQSSNLMPPNHEGGMKSDRRGGYFDGYGGGVYAYDGQGSGPVPSMKTVFDDYGRPITLLNDNLEVGLASANKIVKAAPKFEEQNDSKSGVQKFRVNILAEGGGQSNMDVLCQVYCRTN